MISEGSCDTEDLSNENSAAVSLRMFWNVVMWATFKFVFWSFLELSSI